MSLEGLGNRYASSILWNPEITPVSITSASLQKSKHAEMSTTNKTLRNQPPTQSGPAFLPLVSKDRINDKLKPWSALKSKRAHAAVSNLCLGTGAAN